MCNYINVTYTTGKGWAMKYIDIELIEIDGKYYTLKKPGCYIPNLSNINSAIGQKTKLPKNIVEIKKTKVDRDWSCKNLTTNIISITD